MPSDTICAIDNSGLDTFMACLDKHYRLNLPRQADFPTDSQSWHLFSCKLQFTAKPGYLYWAKSDCQWQPLSNYGFKGNIYTYVTKTE